MKPVAFSGLFALLVLAPQILFPQPGVMRGTLLDMESRAPVANAHLKIRNTWQGTYTSSSGTFSLNIRTLPAIIDITCIGYENITLEVAAVSRDSHILYLRPKIYQLPPLTVSASPTITLFRDRSYSVLDYVFHGDNLLLIVFRNRLKRAEMVLLSSAGDTMAVAPVPSSPPAGLYKDVLSNVHFIDGKGNAYQAVYDPVQDRLVFPYRTTYDSIKRFLGKYSFREGDHLWFQEDSPSGFMTSFGYYSRKEGRVNIGFTGDRHARYSYYSDAPLYHTVRPMEDPIDGNESRSVDAEARAYQMFYFQKSCGKLFRVSDTTLAFFDFCSRRIEIMDMEGRLLHRLPLGIPSPEEKGFLASLLGSLAGTRDWIPTREIIQDEAFRDLYAVFNSKGFVSLSRIDLNTGMPGPMEKIPFEFPEKVRVFRGEVYFLYRGIGDNMNRKLYKMTLP